MDYILTDRTTGLYYELKIDNEELYFESTLTTGQDSYIFEDTDDSSKNYALFISDGEMATELTATVRDDYLSFYDSTSGKYFRIMITDSEVNYREETRILLSPVTLEASLQGVSITVTKIESPILLILSIPNPRLSGNVEEEKIWAIKHNNSIRVTAHRQNRLVSYFKQERAIAKSNW